MGLGFYRASGVAVFALALILLVSCSDADIMASAGKSWSRLGAGEDALFPIDQEGVALTEIGFTLESMIENVYIELDVLSDNDTLIETPAPDEVYQYIRIMSTNIQVANLEKATVRFRVPNTWISGSNVKKENISLYRYETSWSGLNTSLIREDEDYQYYETPVNKFSLFAISGEKAPAEALCSSGEAKCIENDLYQCSEDGMAWNLMENCTYGCDAGECRPEPAACPECPAEAGEVCSPGEQKCSGNDLQQCNSEGSGWEMVRDCPGGCVLCAAEEPGTDANLLYMAVVICQVVIGILIVVVIALIAYMRLHK